MARTTLLCAAIVGTGSFGLAMVLLPGLTRSGFSLLLLGDAARMDSFDAEARGYITLLHGVLGAVMVGWSIALWRLCRPAPGPGWRAVGASVTTWCVIDTAYSAWLAAWPNVALNLTFAAAFAAGLWVVRSDPPPRASPIETARRP